MPLDALDAFRRFEMLLDAFRRLNSSIIYSVRLTLIELSTTREIYIMRQNSLFTATVLVHVCGEDFCGIGAVVFGLLWYL